MNREKSQPGDDEVVVMGAKWKSERRTANYTENTLPRGMSVDIDALRQVLSDSDFEEEYSPSDDVRSSSVSK